MLAKSVLKELRAIVGKEHLRTAAEDLTLYGYDATPFTEPVLPDAVAFPGTADEVAAVVRLANREGFAVIPRGAGSNLTGGTRPVRGGVVLSTQRMNRILRIDPDNLQAVVQPGVVNQDLGERAAEDGLFYAPDPQSLEYCTIGGNLAENAGGPRAVKYGVTRQHVLGCEAVLAAGQLVRLGARTLKSVVGYDLLSLLVGSEGTLGVITEATLRLLPKPACRRTLLAAFARMEDAAAAVAATFRARVLPSAIEFLDGPSIRCIEEHQPCGLPSDADAVLLVEVDGGAEDTRRDLERVAEVLRRGGAHEVRPSADEQQAEALWRARRAVGPSLARIAPIKMNEDVVVPLDRLPRAVSGIHALAARYGIACACFGHAGDGNIHVNFLTNPQTERDRRQLEQAVEEMFALVVELGGSITGEHGVGTTKQPYIGLELSPDVVAAMAAIKRALDPAGIMNPGKVLPAPPPAGAGGRPA